MLSANSLMSASRKALGAVLVGLFIQSGYKLCTIRTCVTQGMVLVLAPQCILAHWCRQSSEAATDPDETVVFRTMDT